MFYYSMQTPPDPYRAGVAGGLASRCIPARRVPHRIKGKCGCDHVGAQPSEWR